MQNALNVFVVFMILIVALGLFNEKVTRITNEIALMLFSMIIGVVGLLIESFTQSTPLGSLVNSLHGINLQTFLMHGILCFMLFSGSCHMKIRDFKEQARAVTVLSVVATFLGAVFYGLLFYGISCLLNIGFTLPACLMFGSIIAPTDPIAATSILNKFGLPKKISFLIEGESLLNDGVGVALFVCFSGMLAIDTERQNFFLVMGREIFGAVAIGVGITLLCYPIFMKTKDSARRIFTSMLAVSSIYLICEYLEFSGAIASVVCGVMFSSYRTRLETRGETEDVAKYDNFWEILDQLMNSILYVILGLSFIYILQLRHVVTVSLIAIVCNFLCRAGSVGVCTFLMGKIPDGYNRRGFTALLTWGGLRGGLSLALAMSTVTIVDERIYHIILGGTCAVVFFTTIVQGLTMKKVYQRIERSMKREKKLA